MKFYLYSVISFWASLAVAFVFCLCGFMVMNESTLMLVLVIIAISTGIIGAAFRIILEETDHDFLAAIVTFVCFSYTIVGIISGILLLLDLREEKNEKLGKDRIYDPIPKNLETCDEYKIEYNSIMKYYKNHILTKADALSKLKELKVKLITFRYEKFDILRTIELQNKNGHLSLQAALKRIIVEADTLLLKINAFEIDNA